MKPYLIILLALFLFSACQRTTLYNENDVSLSKDKEGAKLIYDVPVKSNEWSTITRYIEPYQMIGVSCEQPFDVMINGETISSKLKDGRFDVDFITMQPEAMNYEFKSPSFFMRTVSVDDRESIYLKLSNDSMADSSKVHLYIFPKYPDKDIKEILKNSQNNSFWSKIKLPLFVIFIFIIISSISVFLMYKAYFYGKHISLKSKTVSPKSIVKPVSPKKNSDTAERLASTFAKLGKNKVTPEDILKHVDD